MKLRPDPSQVLTPAIADPSHPLPDQLSVLLSRDCDFLVHPFAKHALFVLSGRHSDQPRDCVVRRMFLACPEIRRFMSDATLAFSWHNPAALRSSQRPMDSGALYGVVKGCTATIVADSFALFGQQGCLLGCSHYFARLELMRGAELISNHQKQAAYHRHQAVPPAHDRVLSDAAPFPAHHHSISFTYHTRTKACHFHVVQLLQSNQMSSPQPGSEFWRATGAIKDDLENHTKRRYEVTNRFVTYQDLVKILQKEGRIHKVLYTDCLTTEDLHNIQHNFIVILTTLVSIGATHCLANFRSLFLTGSITDKDLPLEREQIETFLPGHSELVDQFEYHQYDFCPTVISCTRPLHCVPSKSRLPFEKKPENLGIGGFGEVDLVTITPGYWEFDRDCTNSSAYKVACKKFSLGFKEAFLKEYKNLTILKESLTTQSHILQHYTAVDHDQHSYYILFPYAEHGDLHQFLHGGAGSYELHNQFPRLPVEGDPAIFKPLLHQCWALACAIEWLHDYIQVDGEHIMCAHLDLKPENILIRNDASSVVGKWMISDFGISVLEPQKLDSSRPLSVRGCYREPTIEVNPHGGRGTYRPPEAINRIGSRAMTNKIGRRSDIWAYGCIFTEVLAWAIGRREGVEYLAQERQIGITNDFFWDEHFGQSLSPQATGFKVRDSVVRWLDHIQTSPEKVVGEWVKTIKDILIIDKESRPKAQKLVTYVSSVYKPGDVPRDPDSQPIGSPVEPSSRQSPIDPVSHPVRHIIHHTVNHQVRQPVRLPVRLPVCHPIECQTIENFPEGKVPIAVVSNDKVEVLSLDLSRRKIREVQFLALFGKLGNAEVVIEGQYLAVWGFCKEEGERMRILKLPDLEQTFTQAIFNARGDFLFAWARSSKKESLYVWKIEGLADEPDFAVHYSLNRYLAVTLNQQRSESHGIEPERIERPFDTLNVTGREVLEIPKSFKLASKVRAYEQQGVVTVVLWNETSLFISDLPPSDRKH
ncbi:kinase-like protein [Aspergillus phoenicis ATCC 13157]|uniref:Kinase-like protein n=1 Tax=Aspergillus phoenicis ATCC 13157 TaxID=1353007 RepID=A0A370P6J6_ASPPH|nr:kinase-like protein [Aspergillus phoenicis ATCC 13157]